MCRGVDFEKKRLSGALILLQLWAWDRFPFLAPHRDDHVHNDPYAHLLIPPPLGYRWRNALLTTQVLMHVLIKYREMLDMQSTDQVIWLPYTEDVINALPAYCQRG